MDSYCLKIRIARVAFRIALWKQHSKAMIDF